MKALMSKEIEKIQKDALGKKQLQEYIGSNQKIGTIRLSNGDAYKIMPKTDYLNLIK
ncbi:hypothetical protein C8546_23095 [Salmonella enterica subsp. enterica serovar Muenchen]|nr:hypothetical protein [Salmonella enterica subsp. enterica serovar Muenchen]